MFELIKELEYNKKINEKKGLDNVINIDYVLARLRNINVYEEYIKGEINYNIENMINDDIVSEEDKEKLMKLTDEDINNIFDNIGYNDYDMGQLNEEIEYEINKYIGE